MTPRLLIFWLLALTGSSRATADDTPVEAGVSEETPAEVNIDEFESGRVKMVRLEPGSFTMGLAGGVVTHLNSEVQSAVIDRAFMVGAYEVTEGLYRAVMGQSESDASPTYSHPKRDVSWFDAVQFCNKLSELEGFDPVYAVGVVTSVNKGEGQVMAVTWNRDANGYRLPTEAEWEYAARGGTNEAFGTANQASDVCGFDNLLDQTRWESLSTAAQAEVRTRGYGPRRKPSGDKPMPCADGEAEVASVGSFSANGFGLYDTLGNVREWVWAWQNIKRMRSAADTSQFGDGDPALNKLVARRVMHIVRGQSFVDGHAWAHVGARSFRRPHKPSPHIGFRVVRTAN
jgi:sulfatase modifying factor 1